MKPHYFAPDAAVGKIVCRFEDLALTNPLAINDKTKDEGYSHLSVKWVTDDYDTFVISLILI